MVAAGYALYGSGVMVVISTGDAPSGFTLDPVISQCHLCMAVACKSCCLPEYWRVCFDTQRYADKASWQHLFNQ